MVQRVLALVLLLICSTQSAKILIYIPTPSYSHQIVFQPIWKELSREHEVTVITTDPLKDATLTNLTEIDVSFSYEAFNHADTEDILLNNYGFLETIERFQNLFIRIIIEQLKYKDVKNLIEGSEEFDLVMFEYIHPIGSSFGQKFKCPVVGLVSLDLLPNFYNIFGNPVHPAVYPHLMFPFFKDLTFTERLINTFIPQILSYKAYDVYKKSDLLIKTYFGEDYPTLSQSLNEVDLIFINVNPAFRLNKPIVPSIIEFGGGIHIQPPKPLPKDIQTYLDGASEGVIYFSLGTNVRGKFIPDDLRDTFIKTISELPYKVLWKFDEDLEIASENVKLIKWGPQQDILRHPNIKLFITQCGLQSLEETLYSHVPVVGIPFFGDQMYNSKMVESLGIGVILEKNNLKKDVFNNAILEVISNTKYKDKITTLANLSRDQPMSSVDKVVWWTNHVLRNKGAKHLRSLLRDLPFYKYYMLDIIGFTALVLYILFKLLKFIFCKLCRLVRLVTRRKDKIL